MPMVSDRTGPTRSSSLSLSLTLSPPLLYGYTGYPVWDGTERDRADMGSGSNGTNTDGNSNGKRQQVHMNKKQLTNENSLAPLHSGYALDHSDLGPEFKSRWIHLILFCKLWPSRF